ncbi:MAG: aspartate aminotransferase family protein [Nitrospirae bacterium]|nr:aspartate aminotransferase family protein [Nitrospirota bacterium]
MSSEEIIQDAERYLMHTYKRQPLVLVKGRGSRVYDAEGREYLDFVSGLAVNNLGHCPPQVTVAFQKQAQRLVHVSNIYYTEPAVKLAKMLVEHSFADQVFFCNSGAEANEAAIKLARKYGHDKREGRYEIITATKSFHGRTMATITATGQEKFWKGFEPLVPGFSYVPFNDVAAVEKAITPKTIAVMVEPVQGEGGVNVPDKGYLQGLRRICDARGILLILDEVQTGIGRTGTLFAYEQFDVTPDIMTLAKAVAGGLPMGVMLAKKEISEVFVPGTHASTFGGNPLVCSAAVATLETLLEDGMILDNCRRMGRYLTEGLREVIQPVFPEMIKEIRNLGLLVGMELNREGADIVAACRNAGVLINCTMDRVLRFLPPLTVTEEEIDVLLKTLHDVLTPLKGRGPGGKTG